MIQHVKRKRSLLRNDFLLHHGNARPHIARCVLDVSQQNIDILPHLPYSPDKTPCDFWLFRQFKKPLRGKRFASNKKIPVVTLPELRPFTTNGFSQTTSSRSVQLQRFVETIFSNTNATFLRSVKSKVVPKY
ncbi:histone-lysine N-methyltransferase SETMAR [Trichonephila clavipes]|nr:histone-lysine N-methyltransferase SETMAR [Trichonephila clavipes]